MVKRSNGKNPSNWSESFLSPIGVVLSFCFLNEEQVLKNVNLKVIDHLQLSIGNKKFKNGVHYISDSMHHPSTFWTIECHWTISAILDKVKIQHPSILEFPWSCHCEYGNRKGVKDTYFRNIEILFRNMEIHFRNMEIERERWMIVSWERGSGQNMCNRRWYQWRFFATHYIQTKSVMKHPHCVRHFPWI